ncbi:MAG: calcium/sodium antiporter [Thermoguttaceae bacterium]|nr:calcium/sodium antiporter [Thermoguttaceae bacterium]
MNLTVAILLVILGGALLVAGGELLVRGATHLSALLAIPPVVVGLTVVAAGTSAPELAVSLMSCFRPDGGGDMALGNVVGSSICNILLILGLPALICPLTVTATLIKREMPVMICVSLLLWGVIGLSTYNMGHIIPQWSGFVFLALFAAYCVWTIREVRKSGNKSLANSMETSYAPAKRGLLPAFQALICVVIGLGLLIFGSGRFIDGAVFLAEYIGVSKLVIGLTVLAVGTSLPELVVSVIAAVRGRADLAIGNVVGSNIFNILIVLGVTASFVPKGIPVSHQAFCFDIPVMVATAVLGTYLCATDKELRRWEGFVLLLCYIVYLTCLAFYGGML